jgi:RHS repeat-associated protein
VLAVVSDKTKNVCNNDTVQYFTAEVLYAYDYSPFGAILPGRQYVADTSCTTTIDYDTAYNDHYTITFAVTTLLSPGQTIRLATASTSKVLATYNPGYVNPASYIGQILSNVSPGGDGIEAVSVSFPNITLRFSADSLGFSCGNVVTAYSGSTSLSTVTIDCAIDSIYAVDTFTTCSSSDYRFGFNGMEKDNSVKGTCNSYDFGARIYDSRLGRFLSVDPLSNNFADISSYQMAYNNPILMIDLLGLKGVLYIQVMTDENGNPVLDQATVKSVIADLEKTYKELGVDLKVEVNYSNSIMTKSEFYAREGADKTDSYVILGSAKQILAQDTKEGTGWEKMEYKTVDDVNEKNGESGATDQIAYINADNVKQIAEYENYKDVVDKVSKVIQHESGHPKFKNHPRNHNGYTYTNDAAGHVSGTIMDEYPNTNSKHDFFMARLLRIIHGKTKPAPGIMEDTPENRKKVSEGKKTDSFDPKSFPKDNTIFLKPTNDTSD